MLVERQLWHRLLTQANKGSGLGTSHSQVHHAARMPVSPSGGPVGVAPQRRHSLTRVHYDTTIRRGQRPFSTSCTNLLQSSLSAAASSTSDAAASNEKQPGKTTATNPSSSTIEEDTNSFPRRSMLYVPGSSDKMIKKSQESKADCIIFDLEDSVATHRKGAARESVLHGLNAAPRPGPELSVRINPPSGSIQLANDDLDIILPSRQLQTLVIPKVESVEDLFFVLEKVRYHRTSMDHPFPPVSLVLSVESANSLLQMPTIIEQYQHALTQRGEPEWPAKISALLFASEDYCASTGIIRTKSRKELLFPRAHMATIAKAYQLQAIDMVCIDYKDMDYLREESTEARQMGFDGKQAIHPNQVASIQETFSPSEQDIERATKIKEAYEKSVRENKGAVGFVEGDSLIMIDAPMLKQADAVLAKVRASQS